MHTCVDTLIVGAGQAGLALSYHLSALGRDHPPARAWPGR